MHTIEAPAMKRLTLTALPFLLLLGFANHSIAQETAKQNDEAKPARQADADEDAKAAKAIGDSDDEEEINTLTIGSPAPSLDVEHWVQDGEGTFDVVTDFEKGKVYVVEFWATWCGPCITSMPHIVELQKKYADQGVQVVSISNEDLETVEKFLERPVRGSKDDEEPKTYRDLTSAYCLTTDPDGSSSEDYMRAANQTGIPCAFIVGKTGAVEWIGHPMSMDDALAQVVSDNWDRNAFRDVYVAQQKTKEVLLRVSRAMRTGATEEAVALMDDYMRELMKSDSYDASIANGVAWRVYQLANVEQIDDEVVKSALKVARSRVKQAGATRAYLLDTVAHLQHVLGNSKQALKTQRRAMKAATAEQKPRLQGFLKELEDLAQPKPQAAAEQAAEPDGEAAEAAAEKRDAAESAASK
jgi:thiol-disulfide isomerase/thioredoxin